MELNKNNVQVHSPSTIHLVTDRIGVLRKRTGYQYCLKSQGHTWSLNINIQQFTYTWKNFKIV